MPRLNMKKTSAQVEWCLQHRPKTRSDDTHLTLSVWRNFHKVAFMSLVKVCLASLEIEIPETLQNCINSYEDLPSSEACSRARRKFNEKGMYLPSRSTLSARRLKQYDVLDWVRDRPMDTL